MKSPEKQQASTGVLAASLPSPMYPGQSESLQKLQGTVSTLKWVLVSAFLLHLAMFAYDLSHPDVFLNADRSASRFAAIQGLQEAWVNGSTASYLASHGIVGDYLFQALIIGRAGNSGLILVQISLALAAGYAVFRLGQLLGLSDRLATLACAIYLLFPHTLLFPHQLAAEGLYTPLLAISLWLAAEFVFKPHWQLLLAGGLLLGMASLIRPITLLWPVLVGIFLARACQKRAGLAYLLISLLPLLLWMSFIGLQTGSFGMGKSEHDVGHNLYQRVWRISETLPAAEAEAVHRQYLNQGDKGSLGVPAYLQFGLSYPAPFLKHAARDTVIFVAKSGVERIPIDYFEMNAEARSHLQDAGSGWRSHLEQEGVLSTIRLLWQTQGMVLIISLLGSLLMLGVMAAALTGCWQLLSRTSGLSPVQGFVAAQLICLPIYILIFSQVVDALQSRHRAPAEAALVLLAVLGGASIVEHFSRSRPPIKA